MPREQINERSALTLLSLVGLRPQVRWKSARTESRGVTQMMEFMATEYRKRYAPNTRETVRRYALHQFVQAGIALKNADDPLRPTNSPDTVYCGAPPLLELLKTFGTTKWESTLRKFLIAQPALSQKYAAERTLPRLRVKLRKGQSIALSPGGQNVLVKRIVEDFCQLFTPGASVVYVGDTSKKWAYFDQALLSTLGIDIEKHGKMPDVVVYQAEKGWLVLIEAITSHGPVTPKRQNELKELFGSTLAGLVFVSAFLSKKSLLKYLQEIAWETEVWVAEHPTHIIHFNGERFLGPYESTTSV